MFIIAGPTASGDGCKPLPHRDFYPVAQKENHIPVAIARIDRYNPRRPYKVKNMIELEVYAAGVRSLEKILELDHELEAVPGLRYKVDSNHDIVYLDFDEPTLTIQEIRSIFRKLSLEPRVVGAIPGELNPKSKTQPLRV